MPTNRRILSQDAAVSAASDSAQGLILHLDANDEDSIESGGANTGAGSGTWFDIANHDLNVPLVDKASNLQLHLNASDTTSYSGSGTTWTDISGNSRNGTINGGVESTYATDIRGSFDFTEGTGDFVNVSHHVDIKPSTSGVTYELWITPEEISNTDTYLYSGSDGGYGSVYFRLENGVPSQTAYNSSNGAVTDINTGTALTAGSLHHVVLSISHTTNPVTKIYQDGTLKVTNTGSGTIHYLTDDLKIGRYTTGNANDFNGLIHAVRVYNTVLTASEVAQNFRAGNFLSYSSIYNTNLSANFDPANYTSGTWDDSVGGISGTLSNAVFDKELGNFFSFDGSGDIITMPDNSVFDMTANTSFEIWIRRNNTDRTFPMDKAQNTPNSYGWQFEFTTSNGYRFQTHNTSNATVQPETGSQSTTGLWECVSVTISSSNEVKIYLDGIFKQASTLGGTISTNSSVLTLGHYSLTSSFDLNGQIGDLKFYSAELTSAQVAQNYLATKNDYPNGNNATNNGANFSATTPAYFDFATNDYFETSISKNWASIPFSVEMWFNTDSRNGEFLWGLNDTAGNGIAASVRGSSNSFHLQFLGSGVVVSAGVVDINEWYQVVFTSDGTTKKAYLNGSFVASGTTTISSGANSKAFIFGRYGTANAGYYDGKIGLVKLFDKELTSSEVTANYDADKATYGLS